MSTANIYPALAKKRDIFSNLLELRAENRKSFSKNEAMISERGPLGADAFDYQVSRAKICPLTLVISGRYLPLRSTHPGPAKAPVAFKGR